jgi:L-ascorbate metabolism protein UlaG (beta-lactamase superfamily)
MSGLGVLPDGAQGGHPFWRKALGTVRTRADTGHVAGPDLQFVGHSTVRVELAGRTVLTDPLLGRRIGPLRRVVPLPDPAAWAGVDVVLISHLHNDHLHLPSLGVLGRDVRIVVPRGAGRWMRRLGFRRVDELSAGETLTDGDLRITAVRADHSGHRWGPRLEHGPETESLGHLLEGAGSSVYLSRDTAH